jgi:hypothetical protein
MSRLYSSPEVSSLGYQPWSYESWIVVSSSLRPGAHHANLIAAQSHSIPILPYVAVDKDALPHSPSVWRGLHQIIPPAKTSTGFSREFSSAISGFRSLCGRKRRSSLSHRAQVTCVLEPFTRGGLSL